MQDVRRTPLAFRTGTVVVIAALAAAVFSLGTLVFLIMDRGTPAVVATSDAGTNQGTKTAAVSENTTSAKLPKGSALLPMKVSAAERAAVEAGDYKAFPYLTWLAGLGPWHEAQPDGRTPSQKSASPARVVLFLADDGRTWASSSIGITRTAYVTSLPPGVTATVRHDLQTVEIVDTNTNRQYTAGVGQPFTFEQAKDAPWDSDVFAVWGSGAYAMVDFERE